MPIKPENKKRYPANWKDIRKDILKRAIKNECHDGTESDCAYLEGKSAGWNDCLDEIARE